MRCFPLEHREFLHSLKFFHLQDDYLFIHADINEELLRCPMKESERRMERYVMETGLLSSRRLAQEQTTAIDTVIVFGHIPFATPLVMADRIGIDTGAVYGNMLTAVELPHVVFFMVETFLSLLYYNLQPETLLPDEAAAESSLIIPSRNLLNPRSRPIIMSRSWTISFVAPSQGGGDEVFYHGCVKAIFFQNMLEKKGATVAPFPACSSPFETETDIVGMGIPTADCIQHGKMEFDPGVEIDIVPRRQGVIKGSGRPSSPTTQHGLRHDVAHCLTIRAGMPAQSWSHQPVTERCKGDREDIFPTKGLVEGQLFSKKALFCPAQSSAKVDDQKGKRHTNVKGTQQAAREIYDHVSCIEHSHYRHFMGIADDIVE